MSRGLAARSRSRRRSEGIAVPLSGRARPAPSPHLAANRGRTLKKLIATRRTRRQVPVWATACGHPGGSAAWRRGRDWAAAVCHPPACGKARHPAANATAGAACSAGIRGGGGGHSRAGAEKAPLPVPRSAFLQQRPLQPSQALGQTGQRLLGGAGAGFGGLRPGLPPPRRGQARRGRDPAPPPPPPDPLHRGGGGWIRGRPCGWPASSRRPAAMDNAPPATPARSSASRRILPPRACPSPAASPCPPGRGGATRANVAHPALAARGWKKARHAARACLSRHRSGGDRHRPDRHPLVCACLYRRHPVGLVAGTRARRPAPAGGHARPGG